MNPNLKPLVVVLALSALVAYIGTFAVYAVQTLGVIADPVSSLAATADDQGSGGAIDYVWTSVSVLVGAVVAVALGQPEPARRFDLPKVENIIVYYAWAWFGVGISAIVVWFIKDQSGGETPLIIRNAATTFIGLAIPVITAFLRDGDASIVKS